MKADIKEEVNPIATIPNKKPKATKKPKAEKEPNPINMNPDKKVKSKPSKPAKPIPQVKPSESKMTTKEPSIKEEMQKTVK